MCVLCRFTSEQGMSFTFVVGFPFHIIYFHVEVFLVWFYDESLGCGMRAYGKAKRKAWPGRSGRELVFDHSI